MVVVRLTLRLFIIVMWEFEVVPARVDIYVPSQYLASNG